jgi:CheY-like chemotaxis protein
MKEKTFSCLLVEDDPEDQELFIDALHEVSSNTGCYAVENGEEALALLTKENQEFDFIFTDLRMPRMGGLAFIRVLRTIQHLKNTPVIVWSSHFSDADKSMLMELGVAGFFIKTRKDLVREFIKKYFVAPQQNFIL